MDKRIHDLFEKNRDIFQGKPVAFDGVVEEERYASSKEKVAFLLKDINGEETVIENGIKVKKMMEHDWEYMKWLREDTLNVNKRIYKTWPNVCMWMEVFRNPRTSYIDCLNDNGEFDEKRLRFHLLDIAIVNIKKTPGKGSSDYDEIKEATIVNKELLKDEFNILAPKVVVCGGTFEFAKTIYDVPEKDIEVLPSGAKYFIMDNRVFLDFVHPMWYMVPRNILFNYAKNVFYDVREMIKAKEENAYVSKVV